MYTRPAEYKGISKTKYKRSGIDERRQKMFQDIGMHPENKCKDRKMWFHQVREHGKEKSQESDFQICKLYIWQLVCIELHSMTSKTEQAPTTESPRRISLKNGQEGPVGEAAACGTNTPQGSSFESWLLHF